jgi:WD40 repeat protein
VKLWDAASGRLLKTLEGHTASVLSVAWDGAGARLASAGVDKSVKLWDAASGRLLKTLEGHTAWVWSVAWDGAGARLVTGSADGSIGVFDVSEGAERLVAQLYGIVGAGGLAITPDGYLSGDPDALDLISFADGWALYSVRDLPERVSPERIAEALRVKSVKRPIAGPRSTTATANRRRPKRQR